jgi:hypothetical protein
MQVTRAFIVRPFGTQADINFDRVETDLISPAGQGRYRGAHDRRHHLARRRNGRAFARSVGFSR